MFELICSIDDETSSTDEACSVAPWLSCSEDELSSSEPAATLSEEPRTSMTTSVSRLTIEASAFMSSSLSERSRTSTMRLPDAISFETWVTLSSEADITFMAPMSCPTSSASGSPKVTAASPRARRSRIDTAFTRPTRIIRATAKARKEPNSAHRPSAVQIMVRELE